MGSVFDAFQTGDPKDPLPNLRSYTDKKVFETRLDDLRNVVESEFRRGRLRELDKNKTLHESSTVRATTMMASEQIKAFDIALESSSVIDSFGDNSFGRGCLAAIRLIEQGVRCVEVELSGWDSHVENYSLQSGRCKILDAALHSLIKQLVERGHPIECFAVIHRQFKLRLHGSGQPGSDRFKGAVGAVSQGRNSMRPTRQREDSHERSSGSQRAQYGRDPVNGETLGLFGLENAGKSRGKGRRRRRRERRRHRW